MPNHITNIITAPEYVLNALVRARTEKEIADHEKYEERRREQIEKRSEVFTPETLAPLLIDFGMVIPIPEDDDPRITATKSEIVPGMIGWSFDGLSPMDFARELWGTKWNAYSQEIRSDQLKFDTAWSHPFPVLEALSRKFPEAVLEVRYADEDFGSNLGHYTMQNGEVLEQFVSDDSALEVREEFAAQTRYGKSYAEIKAQWDADSIASARKAMFVQRLVVERGVENGYTIIREEGLEIPADIEAAIQTIEDAEAFWEK